MRARDLRDLGPEELAQKLREMTQELGEIRLRHKSGIAVEKPERIRKMRRVIARIKTVQTEREVN